MLLIEFTHLIHFMPVYWRS